MRAVIAIYIFSILNILASYSQSHQESEKDLYHSHKLDSLFRFEDISRDTETYNHLLFAHKLAELEDSIYIYVCLNDTLYLNNISDCKLIKINITTRNEAPLDFLLYDKSHLALLYEEGMLLYNLNTRDTTFIPFNFNENIKVLSEIIAVQSLMNHNFGFIDGSFYIPLTYQIWANTTEGLQELYSYPSTMKVNASSGDVSFFGQWPANYTKGHYFGSFFYWITKGLNNELIYSFPSSDSLFFYNDLVYSGSIVASPSIKEQIPPFPLSALHNYGELRKYNIENPKYEQLLVNKSSEVFYRVYKPKCSFLKSDKIRRARDIPWEILIFDKSFKKIDEKWFDPEKYSFYRVYSFKESLYIINELEDNLENQSISYHKITFNDEK